MKQRKAVWLLLAVLFILALVACGGSTEPTAEETVAETTTDTTADTTSQDNKPTITLIENPWPASELNIAVAKILIESQLGYTVETVALDESAQWAVIASGDADASLEVWPSGHGANIQQYIQDEKVVEDGGPLGPMGSIGWYVPTYVIEEHPDLASWEGFKNPDNAKLFATAETGDNGQFLAGSPGWTQYDTDIIRNLGLPLQVIVSGSEEALLAAVSAAYERHEPILFYFYTPHAIFSKYDLTQVTLPEYSDDCYAQANSGGVACAYPADVLLKIFSTGLKEKSPDVYTLLQNFNYTNDDQIAMLGMLEEGKSVAEAAQSWVDTHQDVWQKWLP